MSELSSNQGSGPTSSGWYPDPWKQSTWRWWDGGAWTANCSDGAAKKPLLPSWLSVPVAFALVPTLIVVGYLAWTAPVAVALGLVPLALVGPVLAWLDRVEPETWASRIHALLWGATVAAVVSLIVNSVVAWQAGETVGAVVSAPIIEEAAKAAGILWALRRREVDGTMDGIVYAGWVALGFAVIEDGLYFADASQYGILTQTFVVRALLTPFAHPLFTVWTGIAIGRSVAANKPPFPSMLWGYVLAVGLHATWNGSLSWAAADEEYGPAALVLALVMLVALFVAMALVLASFRRREQKRFTDMVPFLVQRYAMTPAELAAFGNWREVARVRGSLTRRQRKTFDSVHAALARLTLFHARSRLDGRSGAPDPVEETRLVAQLNSARQGLGARN